MARVIFMLVAFVCMFQTLAAPLQSRAITSGECSQLNTKVIIGIGAARGKLGSINTVNDVGNARDILEAQLSLLDANNGTTQIADALLPAQSPRLPMPTRASCRDSRPPGFAE
ncbi:hypothetical protein B0H14DRAFT_3136909 [Mycena olivaceomarginata]|nr:hypothetical protein B0H14DRAFT_3136909 [Mycena olivaceomarginata]